MFKRVIQKLISFFPAKERLGTESKISHPPTTSTVLQTRPKECAQIEEELCNLSSTSEWFTRDGRNHWANEYLRLCKPAQGWVVSVEKRTIKDQNEGPDYHIWYAFENDGEILTFETVTSFDVIHWQLGSPEYLSWFTDKLTPGSDLTILQSSSFDAGGTPYAEYKIFPTTYAALEPYTRLTFEAAVDQFLRAQSDELKQSAFEQVIKFLFRLLKANPPILLQAFERAKIRVTGSDFKSLREGIYKIQGDYKLGLDCGSVVNELRHVLRDEFKLIWAPN